MELNQFRDVDIVLDKANDNIIQKQFVSAGDKDGRSLTVQLTDNGVIGEIIGATLNLYWHNQASGLTDLSAFYVVDRATSVFKIDYPQNMLTPGKVIAYIQILHGGKVTHTKPFEITVQKLAGTTRGVLATAEYGALVNTLAKANEFEGNIRNLDLKKADETSLVDAKTEISTLKSGKVDKNGNSQITLPMLSQEVKQAMTGGSVAVVGIDAIDSVNVKTNSILERHLNVINTANSNAKVSIYSYITIEDVDGIGAGKALKIVIKPRIFLRMPNNDALAFENGGSNVTLPAGVFDEINKVYTFNLLHNNLLVYNTKNKTVYVKLSESDISAGDILLANCYEGRCQSGIIKDVYDDAVAYRDRYFIYPANDNFYHHEYVANATYIKFTTLNVRNIFGGSITMTSLLTKFPEKVATSPNGEANCLKFIGNEALVYDILLKDSAIVPYDKIKKEHIVLLYFVGGRLQAGILYKKYLEKEVESLKKSIGKDDNAKVPEHWKMKVSEKIESIKNLQRSLGTSAANFAYITDIHIGNNAKNSPLLLKKIMAECDIPFYFNGGDLVTGASNTTKEKTLQELAEVRALYKSLDSKCLMTIGNHDDNSIDNIYDKTVIDKEMYSEVFRFAVSDAKFVVGETGQYYYADDKFNKIRYITLNCIDIPYEKKVDGLLYTGMFTWAFRQEQIDWFSSVALNVPDGEWSVIVSSHVPINSGLIINDHLVMNILQAFKNKTSFSGSNLTYADFTATVNVDYTNVGGDVIAWLAGHLHADKIITMPSNINFPQIVTLNDSLHVGKGEPLKTLGTTTEQAFDIFTVDKQNRKLYATRIGAGSDRVFTY